MFKIKHDGRLAELENELAAKRDAHSKALANFTETRDKADTLADKVARAALTGDFDLQNFEAELDAAERRARAFASARNQVGGEIRELEARLAMEKTRGDREASAKYLDNIADQIAAVVAELRPGMARLQAAMESSGFPDFLAYAAIDLVRIFPHNVALGAGAIASGDPELWTSTIRRYAAENSQRLTFFRTRRDGHANRAGQGGQRRHRVVGYRGRDASAPESQLTEWPTFLCGSRRSATGCLHERVARRSQPGVARCCTPRRAISGRVEGRFLQIPIADPAAPTRRLGVWYHACAVSSWLGLGKGEPAAPILNHIHQTLRRPLMAVSTNFDLRDESGFLVKHHTEKQREAYLLRNPQLVGTLPPMLDPNAMPAWELPTHVSGRLPAAAGLLRDPLPTRKAPTRPEPINYTTMRFAAHEAAHSRVAIACGFEVARVSVVPDAATGGRVIHSQDGSRATQGIVLLAGREGELLMFGNAGGADSKDAERARQLAIAEAGGDEQRAEDLLSAWRVVARKHVKAHERSIRKLAFELQRRRQLDWAEITAVIDSVVQRSIPKKQQELRKAAPKQGRVTRTYNFDNPEDIRAWNKQMGNTNADAEPIGVTTGWLRPETMR